MDRRTAMTLIAASAAAASAGEAFAQRRPRPMMGRGDMAAAMAEAQALLGAAAQGSGRDAFTPERAVRFSRRDNVFLASALAVDFTYRRATATLPLFEGMQRGGAQAWCIITEASDAGVARAMGVNFAPKMAAAAGTPGAQMVTIRNGMLVFPGEVDFAPDYRVEPGPAPTYFPPRVFRPGAIGDSEWSSMCVLPSGCVLNVQMVANRSGRHDRVTDISERRKTVTLSLLDGFHDGRQYYYHLVTHVSHDLPSVLEKGVYTPKLAMAPTYGKSVVGDGSSLLGFSPVLNGKTEMGSGDDQGFSTSIRNGGIDPINIFPIAPTNEDTSRRNNYSPLWDAHVSMWTPAAVASGRVRRIKSLADLTALVRQGHVTSADINPPGPGNPYVAGLRPTRAIINCPVIAQPDLPPQ